MQPTAMDITGCDEAGTKPNATKCPGSRVQQRMDGHVPPGHVPQTRGVRSLATRARVVRVQRERHGLRREATERLQCVMTYGCRASGHAGAYRTTPPSAIFWSRPRLRDPPHNYRAKKGLRTRTRPWRGSLAERDASCIVTGIPELERLAL